MISGDDMIRQSFIEGFKNSTINKFDKVGERILKNDLISEINYIDKENQIEINATVISENLYSQYKVFLCIDKSTKEVLKTKCTCDTFEKKSASRVGYCCCHIVAAFYRFIKDLNDDRSLKKKLNLISKEKKLLGGQNNILNLLINKNNYLEEIKFEVILKKKNWQNRLCVEFKIGKNKFYTVKDINTLLLAIENKVPINYGKDFIFDIRKQEFDISGKKILKFIRMLKEMDYTISYRKVNEKLVNGKEILIPTVLIKSFIEICEKVKIYLGTGFYSRNIESEILIDKIPFPLDLKEIDNIIKLEAPCGIPEMLCESEEVFIYNGIIYKPTEAQSYNILPYIEAFTYGNTVLFSIEEENKILEDLIPSMQKVSNSIALTSNLRNKIVMAQAKFRFYFDKDFQQDYTGNFRGR